MSAERDRSPTVGLIGLGTMGRPVGERLLSAGYAVIGRDIDPQRQAAFDRISGTSSGTVADVVDRADVILTLLPSAVALATVVQDVTSAVGTLRTAVPVVVDLSTLGVSAKHEARDALAGRGVAMLDGAISGTAVQAHTGDLVVYSSGVEALHRRCAPILAAIGRSVHYVGPFGHAAATKLVANQLVAIHVAAAAEALLLARRSGLDPATTIAALIDGAGTSRMLEVRGPMMIADSFDPPAMRMELFLKDLGLIEAAGRRHESPTPLFDAAAALFRRAVTAGFGGQDTAAVSAWLDDTTRTAYQPGAATPTPAEEVS